MSFLFYPKHEHGCPHVNHCPHLGSAGLGTLVQVANENDESRRHLLLTLDAERERNARLSDENEGLKVELAGIKLELKLERQNKFATNQQKQAKKPDAMKLTADLSKTEKKRGAPVGHPGWFRQMPSEYDWAVDVAPPECCPLCCGRVTVDPASDPSEHLQEDIVDNQYRVVLYRHPAACCDDCREWVQQPGDGELLGSRLGPRLRSLSLFLRNVIGISYRKIPQVIQEMYDITFTPAALIGFEKMLAGLAKPVVDNIVKKIAASDDAVHADETYSVLNGGRAYFWVHATTRYVHFTFGTTRSGKVSRDVLGNNFTGTLVTDCYSGYIAHEVGAKQKCLAHLARTARDWQKLSKAGSPDFAFFDAVKKFVKRGCEFHRLRGKGLQADHWGLEDSTPATRPPVQPRIAVPSTL